MDVVFVNSSNLNLRKVILLAAKKNYEKQLIVGIFLPFFLVSNSEVLIRRRVEEPG